MLFFLNSYQLGSQYNCLYFFQQKKYIGEIIFYRAVSSSGLNVWCLSQPGGEKMKYILSQHGQMVSSRVNLSVMETSLFALFPHMRIFSIFKNLNYKVKTMLFIPFGFFSIHDTADTRSSPMSPDGRMI